MLVTQAFLLATISMAAGEYLIYFLWVCLIMACEGSHFVLLPSVFARIYGPRMGAKMYAFCVPSFGLGTILTAVLQRYAISELGYGKMWMLLTGMTVLALSVLIGLFSESSKWTDKVKSKVVYEPVQDEIEDSLE